MRSRRRVAKRASTEHNNTSVTSTSAPAEAWRWRSSYGEIAYVKTCTVSVALDRTQSGQVDPAFTEGGRVTAKQTRTASFTSTP